MDSRLLSIARRQTRNSKLEIRNKNQIWKFEFPKVFRISSFSSTINPRGAGHVCRQNSGRYGYNRRSCLISGDVVDLSEAHSRSASDSRNHRCYAESCGTFLKNAHGGKAADFFVNISNDGIFQRNRAQVWHAAMSAFRAVEARSGIARSSNTGISGFVKPTGEMYGEVVNARGESWTGMGAPELPRIAALVKFRRDHAAELATNPTLAAHVTSEIAAIEELRRTAGVTGQSTQRLYVDSRRTFYSRIGDIFSWILVIFTGAGLVGLLVQKALAAKRPSV
jgi:hypothetical protein